MPRESLHQESFTAGEISDDLKAREDYDQYYKAVDRALNVIVRPTGGLTRRGGLEYIDTIPTDPQFWKNNGENYIQLIDFAAREDEKYLVVLTHGPSEDHIVFYRNNDRTQLTGKLPYSPGEVQDVDWAQKLDVLFLLHEDYKPREVRRTAENEFSVSKISFENIPQYDFDDSGSPPEKNEIQEISFSNMSGGDPYDISLGGEISIERDWSTTASTNASRIQNELRKLPNTSDNGIDVTVKDSTNHVYKVEFTGIDGGFGWPDIIVSVYGGGDASVTTTQEGATGEEDAWSDDRGWPKHGVFYQSRLWFGGSKELPQTVWGSKTGDYFNFDLGESDQDDAIQATINSERLSEIIWIFAGRDLQIGTDSVEFYTPESPITPSNIRFVSSTRRGSAKNVRPVESSGSVYHLQDGDGSLREFVFSFGEGSYKSKNISVLSSHLIDDPIGMSLSQSEDIDTSDIIYIVNDETGNVAILSLLKSQEINGFTEMQTDGRVRETRALDNENYMMTERHIPSQSPGTKSWNELDDPNFVRTKMASASINGKLHLFGGVGGVANQDGILSKHTVFDAETKEWYDSFALPFKRKKGAATTGATVLNLPSGRDEIFYFAGGKDKNGNDTNDFIRSTGNGWVALDDVPIKTSKHSLEEVDGKIYLIDNQGTYIYDPKDESWSQGTTISVNQVDFATAVHDGEIYTFGGTDGSGNLVSTVQKYDVSNDNWTSLTNMPTLRKNASAVYVSSDNNDEIFVIGGTDKNDEPVRANETYDISSDSWSDDPPFPNKPIWIKSMNYNGTIISVGKQELVGEKNQISGFFLSLMDVKTRSSKYHSDEDGDGNIDDLDDVLWGKDGKKLILSNLDANKLAQYNLESSYEIEDPIHDTDFTLAFENPRGLEWGNDGEYLYMGVKSPTNNNQLFIQGKTSSTKDISNLRLYAEPIDMDKNLGGSGLRGPTLDVGGGNAYVRDKPDNITHYEMTNGRVDTLNKVGSIGPQLGNNSNYSSYKKADRIRSIDWGESGNHALICDLYVGTSKIISYLSTYDASSSYDVGSLSKNHNLRFSAVDTFINSAHFIDSGKKIAVLYDSGVKIYELLSNSLYNLGDNPDGKDTDGDGNKEPATIEQVDSKNSYSATDMDVLNGDKFVFSNGNGNEFINHDGVTIDQTTKSYSVAMNKKENKIYYTSKDYDVILEGDVTTPGDVTSSRFYALGTGGSDPVDLEWNNNGKKMYVVKNEPSGIDGDVIEKKVKHEFFLGPNTKVTKYDFPAPKIALEDEGKKLYALGRYQEKIYEYDLTSPYDFPGYSDYDYEYTGSEFRGFDWDNTGSRLVYIDLGANEVVKMDKNSEGPFAQQFGSAVPVYTLERINSNHLLDNSKRVTSQGDLGGVYIPGFNHLRGMNVDVHADGVYRGKKTVDENGFIKLDSEAENYVEAGFDQTEPTIRFLKPTLQSGQSTITDRKKRIVEAQLQLLRTKGLALNGNPIPFREFGDELLDQPIPVFTGKKTVDGMTGWDEDPQLEITQPEPQPLTLLGLIQVVSF